MVKLLVLVTLVTMALTVQGGKLLKDGYKFNFEKFMNRRDPFPEPANPPPPGRNVVAATITQRLDNFDPTNDDTWEQRYLMNGQYFLPGGCIFLFLGGEWAITPVRLEYSLMHDMAQEFSCYMFYLEHRFYGESYPTPDASDENLRFLTVDQALADTAHFITHIRSDSVTPGAEESPVIVIGGHYSGSLAAWFRQSYPHLTIGAWASSAPMLAIADHFQYKELSGAVFRHIGGNECYDRIERGFAEMEQMVEDEDFQELSDMFQLCQAIDSELDVQLFFQVMSEFYSLLAQFDQVVNVAGACDIITNATFTDAEGVAQLLVELLDGQCVNIDYEYIVERERETAWDDVAVVSGFRQYSYMVCTQVGWYHSSLSRFQPFGDSFPLEFIHQMCEDIFTDSFSVELMESNIERFNTLRGGLSPEATNVLYVHGQLDPWRSIGIQNTNHETSPAIIIEGASQGNDLGTIIDQDIDAVEEAQLQIKEIIYQWISDANAVIIIPW